MIKFLMFWFAKDIYNLGFLIVVIIALIIFDAIVHIRKKR